jgi:protein O-mannosyl-transferase
MERQRLLIVCGFFILTFAVYGASLGNEFVRWDDGLLIYENPAVQEISLRSFRRAFTTYDPELYIPLTLLTYQIEYALVDIDPLLYNVDNLILHTLNALLVVWLIALLSGSAFAGIFAGALFAVHPLNTEAVVWASARKDTLSTFFFLSSFILYLRHRRRRYVASIALFACGLLSKVMVLTLPILLILTDRFQGRKWLESLRDKIPFVALSVLFGFIALLGKTDVIRGTTLSDSLLMASKSVMFYLQKFLWPRELSVLYPYTGDISLASPDFFVPLFFFLLFVAAALLLWRLHPLGRPLVFGFSFFLVTIVPTLFNFAKGEFDYYFASDRYAYIPMVGLLFVVAVLLKRSLEIHRSTVFAASAIVLLFAAVAHRQSLVWSNSKTLFSNVLAHYPDSHVAHNNLGNEYRREGELEKAKEQFFRALALREHPRMHANLCAVLRKQGEILGAMEECRRAIMLDPNDPEPHLVIGIVYASQGDAVQALASYERAIAIDPEYAEAYNNLGALHASQGRIEDAAEAYGKAIGANRAFLQAHYNLGIALTKLGEYEQAVSAYEEAIDLYPNFTAARINLGLLSYQVGRNDEAIRQFRAILRYDPGNEAADEALRQIGV